VDAKHIVLVKTFEEEVISLVNSGLEKHLTKKIPYAFANEISKFFSTKDPFKKNDVQQKSFLQDLGLLIVKNMF
jgi:hypothetical protein